MRKLRAVLRRKLREFRRKRLRNKLFGYLHRHYPIDKEMFRDILFVKDLIIKINHGMHYGWPFEKSSMGEIKDDLIAFLLKNFRDQVEVGYLVGAGHKSCMIVIYGDGYKDIEAQLRAEVGGRLINWYIRGWFYDYEPDPNDDVEVCYMYWSDDDYLRYYSYARKGEFSKLDEDYYGLIEINIDGTKIHFIAPRIEKIAPYIRKFDYICCRWRVYGWRKPLRDMVNQKEIALAIWKSTPISQRAREVILRRWILELLIEDKELIRRTREILY